MLKTKRTKKAKSFKEVALDEIVNKLGKKEEKKLGIEYATIKAEIDKVNVQKKAFQPTPATNLTPDVSKDALVASVYATMDYGRFSLIHINRFITWTGVMTLVAAIKQNNLCKYIPFIVDSNWNIYDGQHRFFACRLLGLPINYIIKPDASLDDMADMQKARKGWRMTERCHFYGAQGKQDYIKVAAYAELNDINYEAALKITTNATCTPKEFNNGFYIFQDEIKANNIMKIVNALQAKQNISSTFRARHSRCILGLEMVYRIPGFKVGYMIEKIEKYGAMSEYIHTCLAGLDYKKMFVDLYNWKNTNKIQG